MRSEERRDSIPSTLRLATGGVTGLIVVATLANALFIKHSGFGRAIWIGGAIVLAVLGIAIYRVRRSSADTM